MLSELATTNMARVTEYKARKTRYDQRTFRRDESEYATSEGWELVRENQNSDRYQKLKLHDEQLENEFWCLLYNFGYPNLNVGRSFQIEVTSNKRVTVSKQVDVFGYDHETIVVANASPARSGPNAHFKRTLGIL
jgi:DNA sulfur modification protein DndB